MCRDDVMGKVGGHVFFTDVLLLSVSDEIIKECTTSFFWHNLS